ncbi:MAG TPA: methyl-accepting chemotaxis protein [bacterium]|nr:methyl-accepting chemotaxis protein [bacterium]
MDKGQSLKSKLFKWFGSMIVLVVAIVAVGFWQLMVTHDMVTSELARSLVSGDTTDAERSLDKLTNSQGPVILSLDRTFSDYVGIDEDAQPKYKSARDEMEEKVIRLTESVTLETDKKLAQELMTIFNKYKQNSDKILQLADEGEYEEASEWVDKSKISDDIDLMEGLLKKLGEQNKVDRDALKNKQTEARIRIYAIMIVVVVALIVLSMLIIPYVTSNIAKPLFKLVNFAEAISSGDLTKKLSFSPNRIIGRQGEIGHLFDSLINMSVQLHTMLENVNASTEKVNISSSDISERAQSILSGTKEQSDSIDDVSQSVKQLTTAIDTIADNSKVMNTSAHDTAISMDNMIDAIYRIDESVADLTSQVSNTTAVIAQMSASTAQVHNSAKVMAEAVQETSSTIEEMLASIEEVSLNAKEMDRSVNEASGTVDEMLNSIDEMSNSITDMNTSLKDAFDEIDVLISSVSDVAHDAKEAFTASEETSKVAKSGGKSIQQSIEGMKGIKATVSDTARKIRELGDSSAQIGDIINVIREIADQTNLLALNAAIEAARAGEEGRGFNVVAGSIKQLAERSTEATKEIERLIRNIQNETEKAVAAMDEGVKEVEKGTFLADEAGNALADIVASVERTSHFMQQISVATERQTQSSDKVKQTMTNLGQIADNVTLVTKTQQEGTNRVKSSFDKLSEIAQQVKNSTIEQSKAGNQISQAIETLNGISTQLTSATSEQDKGSNQMELAMENINVRAHEIQDSTSKQKGEGDRVKSQIEKMRDLTQKVTDATLLQSQSSHKIVEKMSNVGKIAEDTTAKSNAVTQGAVSLGDSVRGLEQMISQFTIDAVNGKDGAEVKTEKGLSLVEE